MMFYKTTTYSTSIQEIEIERKTDSTIWFKRSNGKVVSERIRNTYDNGFETKEEAVNHLIELRNERIRALEQQINRQKSEIEEIKLKYAEK